ncbi:MAG: ABC transporter permease subunit, partial [Deltaproteobacteria bacterium]|nr:ABC transporter permease subunit [Deltaproteobacteria bacterium]
ISLGWPRGLAPPVKGWVRMNPEGEVTRVALLADGRLYFTRRATQTDFMGETTTQTTSAFLEGQPGDVWNAAALDEAGHTLYGAASTGDLVGWDLSGESPRMTGRVKAAPVGRAIHTLNWVFGDISLVVADDRGEVSTWFTTPGQDGRPRLTRIHSLEVHPGPVETIIPSRTDKTVLTLDQAGGLYFDHPTSERHLLTLQSRDPVLHAGFSTRGNGLITLDAKGWLTLWNVRNPHPEVSFQSLFGKVWYESYPEPAYVWQSSSASSDFEPKLSLVPLIFGTLKATFYAMLFATPLAIFGAVYTSQLLHPKLHKYIKPTVEVMSAVPTVVIGFLAALWLAPLMEHHLLIPMVFLGVLPLAVVGATWLWAKNAHRPRLKRLGTGYEFVFAIPVLLLAFGVSIWLGGWLEQGFFDGDFRQWHFQTSGTRVDQRNSIIIAFALGFAIIPTIFTIAEDALSNVPAKLTAASLALGASRWQTVWRVVVPSASPGIFAGVMIGFGRAVGETMIVLMATGNTPIMDGSIFNGMRTLSANIAVEIPEAPVSGTLYRVLFLSAVLLFCSTFLFNSIAEVVRHRLRKKYGRF